MGNGAPANSSLIRERLKVLTSAECLKIAERKMGEAIGDRRHGKELKATAQAWLVLAERIAQTEAIEAEGDGEIVLHGRNPGQPLDTTG
jgi:hypothetical protein